MGIQRQVRQYPLVHLGIGLFGNASFVTGGVLFLYAGTKTVGVWLFVVGSFGMLVGSIGELILRRAGQVAERTS
jgi:hypothetical protein